jgi:hypothetical protein
MNRLALSVALLACLSTSYGDTGHDIREHSDLMEDGYCVVSYARVVTQALEVGEKEHIISHMETRGKGLAQDMLRKALDLGHTESEVKALIVELSFKVAILPEPTWLVFAQLIDCAGRTEKYVSVYKF